MAAITNTNLQFFCSGAGSNNNPLLCLGGAISSAQWVTTTALDDLFPDVTGAQAAAGITQYLCLYIKNVDTNVNGLLNGIVYATSQVMPADTNDIFSIALGSAAKNGTEQTITSITTAPTGVTWYTAGVGTITGNTAANPTVVTVSGLTVPSGTFPVTIAGSNSTPTINGTYTATYVSSATFTVPVQCSGSGSAGTVNIGVLLPTPMVQNDYQSVWFRRVIGAGATASGAVYTNTAISIANPSIVTCGAAVPINTVVTIAGATTTPTVNGTWQVVSGGNGSTTYAIPVNVTASSVYGTTTVPSGTYLAIGGDSTA